MADTSEKSTNSSTTQEAVRQQTVDGKSVTGKPPQKPFTGDQIEQSASDSNSSQKQSSLNSAGQDAVSGRQRHGTNERAKGGDAPSSTGIQSTNDSAVNGSAMAHVATPDDSANGRTTPQQHAAGDQQSSAGAGGSGSKKRSAAESSSSTDNGRRSRNSGIEHASDASVANDVAAPGTKDDSKRAKTGEPVVLGGDSDKGPAQPNSGSKGSGLGSAVDAGTKPDLSKPSAHDAGEPTPFPAVGNDATSGAGQA